MHFHAYALNTAMTHIHCMHFMREIVDVARIFSMRRPAYVCTWLNAAVEIMLFVCVFLHMLVDASNMNFLVKRSSLTQAYNLMGCSERIIGNIQIYDG